MKKIRLIAIIAITLTLFGCATTYITSSWKAKSVRSKRYDKIMVVGIIREADRTIRVQMENHLVGDLKNLGYNAFSAYDVYGPKAFDDLSEEELNKKLAWDGVDGVITIVLLDKQREKYYIPERVVYSPYMTYHNYFWGYFHSIHGRIETPGYFGVTTNYFWESNFYDLVDGKLIYSVQTQSFDPSSIDLLAHEYREKIIKSMLENKVIDKQEPHVIKTM